MSRAALCEAAEDGDADKITRMLSGTDPKGAAMRLPHGELVPSFEDTFYEPEHIGFVEGFARRGLRECTATCAERGHAAALRALLDWQPAPDWSFSQQPLTRGELLLEIFHDRFRDAPYMMKKKEHMFGFNDTKYVVGCQSAQLNTLRHVVIWLDPWSRERDLLAAVVDR